MSVNSTVESLLKYTPLIALLIAPASWFIGNYQNSNRDRENKQREVRLQYQIETYRRLAMAAQRKPEPGSKYFRDLEMAVAEIQLFGTEPQIRASHAFLDEWSTKGKGSLDNLLRSLRDDLRQEMNMPPIRANVRWFRPEGGYE